MVKVVRIKRRKLQVHWGANEKGRGQAQPGHCPVVTTEIIVKAGRNEERNERKNNEDFCKQ